MVEQACGSLFIVAAPSGGGKTSLVKNLVENMRDITVSVSHTTRDKRQGEEHETHYFFIDEPTFLDMARADEFIEHAWVFDCLYGTSKVHIQKQLEQGVDVILDIDWQGAAQIKQIFPDAVSIFIVPPSLEILKQRLLDRQRDNADIIEDRMQRACDEMSHYAEFDYLIVNDYFDKASLELEAIVLANRLRVSKQMQKQQALLSFLLASQ